MGSTVRILSANLWNGAAEADAFARLASDLDADVVAVQELAPAQAEALADAFPYGLLEPRTDYNGGGLVLRHPAEVRPVPMGRRHGYGATLDPAAWPMLDAPLEVFGVHVFAPHAYYGLGLPLRWPQMRDLTRRLDGAEGRSQVVVGDFNSTPSWPLYWRMRLRFADAALTVARRSGERPLRTWGPWHGAPRLLRIDHAFVRGGEPETFRRIEVPGSDHSAVLLDLAVNASR